MNIVEISLREKYPNTKLFLLLFGQFSRSVSIMSDFQFYLIFI